MSVERIQYSILRGVIVNIFRMLTLGNDEITLPKVATDPTVNYASGWQAKLCG